MDGWLTRGLQWMLREAVLLYEMFVIVFGGADINWGRTYLACYGVCCVHCCVLCDQLCAQIPGIICVISAPIRWTDYSTKSNCWLSASDGTIWAFIAPVLVAITINLVVFVRVLYAVLVMGNRIKSKRSSAEETDRYKTLKKGVRASLSFLCLLGVTWIFGAVAIGQASVVFFYLFAICNALQGAMIFVFQCLLDPLYVAVVCAVGCVTDVQVHADDAGPGSGRQLAPRGGQRSARQQADEDVRDEHGWDQHHRLRCDRESNRPSPERVQPRHRHHPARPARRLRSGHGCWHVGAPAVAADRHHRGERHAARGLVGTAAARGPRWGD